MKKRFGDLSIGDCFYSYGLYLYKVDAHNAITQQDKGNQSFLFSIHNLVLPVEDLVPIDEMPKTGLLGNSVNTIILDKYSPIEIKKINLQLVDNNILLWLNGDAVNPIEVNITEEGFDVLLPPMIIDGKLNERFIIEQYNERITFFFESCTRREPLTTEMTISSWKKGIQIEIIKCFMSITTRIVI